MSTGTNKVCELDGILLDVHLRCVGCGILAGNQHLVALLIGGAYKIQRGARPNIREGGACPECVIVHDKRGYLIPTSTN